VSVDVNVSVNANVDHLSIFSLSPTHPRQHRHHPNQQPVAFDEHFLLPDSH
jgi:hypothetical protein